MDQGWIQFLLVAVPVMSLIGSWLALRDFSQRPRHDTKENDGNGSSEPFDNFCRLISGNKKEAPPNE